MKRLFALLLTLLLTGTAFAELEFPNRRLYSDVATIELAEFNTIWQQSIIIDVRSALEYNTLHIAGAINLDHTQHTFEDKVRALRAREPHKPIVMYCNGTTCEKSYEAARQAGKVKVSNVRTFDAGIMVWAANHPNETVLLGQTPIKTDMLISPQQFEARLLEPREFGRRVRDESLKSATIDIRERASRVGDSLFPGYEQSASIDNEQRLRKAIGRAKRDKATIFMYDASGKEVQWVQYLLEQEGIKDYYFLKGGARNYFDSLIM